MKNERGFVLIEMILSIGIVFVLVVCFYSVLSFTSKITMISNDKDNMLQNGRYCINYIKREIRSAEKIISINNIKRMDQFYKYKRNFGFIIQKKYEEVDDYKYVIYYHLNNKLYRDAYSCSKDLYPFASSFGGKNEVGNCIDSIEGSYLDIKNNIITIRLTLKDERNIKTIFESKIFVRCPID